MLVQVTIGVETIHERRNWILSYMSAICDNITEDALFAVVHLF